MQSKGMLGVTLQAGEGMVPALAGRKLKVAQPLNPVAMVEERWQQAEAGESIQAGARDPHS